MSLFAIFGLCAATIFLSMIILRRKIKFKYHRILAYTGISFMLLHIAGAFGLY